MSHFLDAPKWQMLKTVLYKTESGKFFAIIIRGDLDVNEIKVRNFIKKRYNEHFSLIDEADFEKIGTVRGFATPLKEYNFPGEVFADESICSAKNYFSGANALSKSARNVNISDLFITEFGDFNEPVEGFTSRNVPGEKLTFRKASEVGNIFYLGDKYSKPFGLSFTDETNNQIDHIEMGCYGIGVSRLMGVIAEYTMTEKGISWPEQIAPYDIYILIIGEENIPLGEKLAKKYESEGKTVILDDRTGSKFGF